MKRRFIFGLVTAVLAANLFLGARTYLSSAAAAEKDSAYPNLKLFSEVMEKVRVDYVEGKDLTYQQLVYGALKGMINTLDPHSEFMDAEKFKELQNDTEGQFGGLGIIIAHKDNFVTVVAPMEDSPGFKAGILSGDRIVKIGAKNSAKMGLEDAVKLLRGEPGTEISLTIERPSSGLVKEFKLKRAVISVDMVVDINGKKKFPLGDKKIGYVRLVQFGEKTSDDLETALKKLKGQGMRALILDLRWNPGGLLDQAVEVCEKFLPRGQLVVSTEGRNSRQNAVHRAAGHGDELVNDEGAPMPVVILANGMSASAAEIVSGCLQDLHRAVVLGEKTFGKGSVQSIIPLEDGSALRLTTARYYTPSHKVIHEAGISPNITVAVSEEEERDILLKRSPGGLETLNEKDRERVQSARDPQLERAADLLQGMLIFSERTSEKPPARAGKMAGK